MNHPINTEKRIIRVFPQKTSYTPEDGYVRIGSPDMFDRIELPPHDEIHVSCTFTWDKKRCEQLQDEWQSCTRAPVLLGGPAYGSKAYDFVQGL